jgi:hypothetical protein
MREECKNSRVQPHPLGLVDENKSSKCVVTAATDVVVAVVASLSLLPLLLLLS